MLLDADGEPADDVLVDAVLPLELGGDRRDRVTNTALGFANHLDHSGFDEAPGEFDAADADFLVNPDRFTPKVDAAAERPQRWIWVHHAPPANSPTSWGGKRFFGDVDLVQWIARYQPSMVISGHVHQSPFIADGSWYDRLGDTWVFNTGLQPGRPPVYIVLDFDENKAFWLPAGDARYIDLKTQLTRPALPITQPPAWLISLDQIADPILAKPQTAAG